MAHFCYACGKAIDADKLKDNMGKNSCPYCFSTSVSKEALYPDIMEAAQLLFVHKNFSIKEITNGGFNDKNPKLSTIPSITFSRGVKLTSSPKLYTITKKVVETNSNVIPTSLCLEAKPISFINMTLAGYLTIRSKYIQSIYDWIYKLN